METDSLQREHTLPEEHEALKTKYKKALQELMHILKVNKSLKDCLDSQAKSFEELLTQRQAETTQRHQAELEAYRNDLQQYKQILAEQTRKHEQGLREREEELADARQHSQDLEHRLQQLQTNGTAQPQPVEPEPLRRKLAGYLQATRERDQLSCECQALKQRVNELTMQLLHERERYRSDIFSKQTEILRSRESEYQKLRTIQSKYQLLESELNNYKTVEKYFEDQADSLLDEDTVYNSIRQQITRINQDFSKYELQSSQILLRKREEDAERNRRIAELEKEVGRLRAVEERLAVREREGEAERAGSEALRQRVRQLEAERDQQVQKNHVLEALTITDKHRVHSGISQRIKEFETRVKLLLEEGVPSGAGGTQQVIVLKGYVRELSELLRQGKRREEHLVRKYQHCKEKLSGGEQAFRAKLGEFKAKIRDYDVLVGKLYSALEEKMKERVPVELEQQFNTAIAHYEQKMVQMSEEIIKLRARVADLEGAQDNTRQAAALEAENQTYKEIISELSVRINELQDQGVRVGETEQELREKDKLIDSLAKEVSSLNAAVSEGRQREASSSEAMQNYERRVARYREELEEKDRISSNLSRNSIDAASLIEKVNYLEYELAKTRTLKAEPSPSPRPDDLVNGLQSKLSAQGLQLAEYKAEIERLYAQLKTEKTEKRTSAVDQYSQISDLQQQIGEWEMRVLTLEKELHSREAQYKDELETTRFQNRALIEQLNSKHSEMMGYYEQLNRKTQLETVASRLPELQRYVAQLERKNHEIIERSSYEANELNASILALRTANLALRNELENKEDAVNELKHQLFNAELRSQKEKPIHGSMIASFSGSISRDSEADRERDREREREREKERQRLLVTVVLLAAEAESLRVKNEQLQAMYHEDLDKYREALKQLETRQMELCNSLQLSSEAHEPREVESRLQISHEAISHLSQNSTAFLADSQKPLQATIRSQEHCPSPSPENEPRSNVSIEASPLKRRGVTVKKIG